LVINDLNNILSFLAKRFIVDVFLKEKKPSLIFNKVSRELQMALDIQGENRGGATEKEKV
jgi:hypothetical protein